MRILVVNDDGYASEGIHTVAALFNGEHDITVVAPKRQRSASSHALSTHTPFSCEEIYGYPYKVYAVDGTPVDCAKFGFLQLFPSPDLIISGINDGRNLGSDIMYSGTVGAAFEAAYYDRRGLALSVAAREVRTEHYVGLARFVKNNLERLVELPLPERTILNINYPDCRPLGVKVAKMSLSRAFGDFYDIIASGYKYRGKRGQDPNAMSDEQYCMQGYITVTPLTMDQTDHAALKSMKREKFIL